MKRIEKILSRDMCLLFVAIWHRGITNRLEDWLGWGYSDSIFHGHDGYVDMYRSSEEHWIEFKNAVLDKFRTDKNWLTGQFYKFKKELRETRNFFSNLEKKPDIASPAFIPLYNEYRDKIEKLAGPFTVVFWLPQWLENDPLKNKYSRELEYIFRLRKDTEFFFDGADRIVKVFLAQINSDLKLKPEWLKVLLEDEFKDFIYRQKIPSESILGRRSLGYFYSNNGIDLTNNKILDIKRFFAKLGFEYSGLVIIKNAEVKGNTAQKGKVKGLVRVILSKDKVGTMREGEILVTAMTTPDYLPAIKKALAFVTDEGGITSHAAIIAREMKKPCIIGTKIATKVLHDGDLVEVDADRGVVKILRKK